MTLFARFPGVDLPAIAAELRRDTIERRALAASAIAKGRLTQAELDWQLKLLAAMAADIAAMLTHQHTPSDGISYADRLSFLRGEVARRHRFYPASVQKGRMTAADARRQSDAMAALLALYEEGWGWSAPNGAQPRWGNVQPTAEERAARAAWQDHWANVMAHRTATAPDSQDQRSMAL